MSDNHHGLIIDSHKLHDRLLTQGLAWSDADAAFKALEDTLKTVLAESFLASTGTVGEREAKARVSLPVKEHLQAMADARKLMNSTRVSYDVAKVFVDLERTNASGQRALVGMQ